MESFEEIKLQTQNAGEEITKARIARTECDSKFEAAGRMLERVGASVDEIQAQIEAKQMSLEALEKEKSEILFGSENSEDNYRSKTGRKDETGRIHCRNSILKRHSFLSIWGNAPRNLPKSVINEFVSGQKVPD